MSGAQGNSFTFDMYFRPLDEAGADDAVQPDVDISVVVPGDSADKVRGSTLDVAGGGMVLQNPNSPSPAPAAAAGLSADLSGPVAQRVLQVLNEQINPAIAAHGGRRPRRRRGADRLPAPQRWLSGLRDGCRHLRQGIEVAIFGAVPEITEVVDATDHASGANPYYARKSGAPRLREPLRVVGRAPLAERNRAPRYPPKRRSAVM